MIVFITIHSELARAAKVEQFNCYTSLADIQLYADTQKIVVTVQTTNNSACDIPHGIKVSLQIDSLGAYEPYVYVRDYDYATTTTIHLKCSNAACSSIPSSASGIIIIESKTKVTRIPAGSVRVSRGVAENCFNDNETYVELHQGAIVLGTVPTFNCINDIASIVNGVLTLNTVNAVKLYITYSDNSITVHQDLIVAVEADVVVPTASVTDTSVPLRIRLSSPTISTYFNQKIDNGVISKDMKFFRFYLQFETDSSSATPLVKVAQVTANFYSLSGFPQAYTSYSIQVLDNGFLLSKTIGPNTATINSQIASLGIDSFVIVFVFEYADNARTDEFRNKLVGKSVAPADPLIFTAGSVQRTCEVRFPNQNCAQILYDLKHRNINELYAFVSYFHYQGTNLVANYSIEVDTIIDSCFSSGELRYDNNTKTLSLTVTMNPNSYHCALVKNDQITIKIYLANTSRNVLIDTQVIDYVPGVQHYVSVGNIIEGNPEININYFREGVILDAVSLTEYVLVANNDLLMEQVYIVLKILGVHFGIVVLYLIWHFVIYAMITKSKNAKAAQQKVKKLIAEDFDN
ncbi:Conserved_hypothetical protein [Hexamita inflata]|uniref:Uncharacterized protein n=1 Tax=Hexamita inflata TaxID=28002 RepID=A0AA86V3T9_9EUKA|nr:Conserved hypothetical protein [Hexamita inflata]